MVIPALVEAMVEATNDFSEEVKVVPCSTEVFWRFLVGSAHQFDSPIGALERTLIRCAGSEIANRRLPPLEATLATLTQQFRAAQPKLEEELSLRIPPIRSQWEAYGPGLARQLGMMIPHPPLVETAEVVAVIPAQGGGGTAHLWNNSCRLEALFANTDDDLPEVLRVAWLVGQLNLDIPAVSERIHGERLPRTAALAMIPATIAAGEALGICRNDPNTIRRAIELWRPLGIDVNLEKCHSLEATISAWWDEFRASDGNLAVALPALDALLESP